uniref:ubiquitinyl hydrolase 1 n=1 Tax=Schistosoma mansoni TaxID=6183 RepID=A0A5K4EXT2_SCHMA
MKHHLQCLWNKVENAPVIVNTDVVRTVYRFNQPACSFGNCQTTCKYLSSCLNGLLKTNVLNEETCDKTESESSAEKLLTHSRNGLKNYGSTCYLNAFLQLYFRFKELRKAIYDIPSQADETGIIHQLQLIFSQLQLNNSGIVDPGGLIEALRLCNTEQQDAPEFHCLFMNLLEARFQHVGVSVIDNLIRGEYIYENSCLKCGFTSRLPSKFLELSLKVSSKSLPDCIRDYLKETTDSSINLTKSDQPSEKCSSRRSAKKRRHDTSSNDLSFTDLDESRDYTAPKCISQDDLWHSSTNAYMVFYESVDNCNLDEDIAVPSDLRKTIEEVNLTEQQKLISEQQNKVNHKNQLLEILSNLKLPDPINLSPNNHTLISMNSLDDVSLVSTSWLRDCLNNPLLLRDVCLTDAQIKSLSKLKDYIFPSSLPNQSSYALRTCSHGRVPIDLAAGSYRAVSTKGLKKLIDILFSKSFDAIQSEDARFDQFQPCRKCITLNIALIKVENAIKELSKELDYFIKYNHLSSSYYKRLQSEKTDSIPSNPEPGYYLIGKRSLRQWKTLARHFTRAFYSDYDDDSKSPATGHHTQTTFNHDILCPHGRICTENTCHLPAILWHKLVDLFPGIKIPTFPIYIPYDNNNNTTINSISIFNKSESSCSECNAVQNDLTERALRERQMLPGLFLSNVQRMRLLNSTSQTVNTTIKIKEDTLNKCKFNFEGVNNSKSENLNGHSTDANKELNNVNTNVLYLIPMGFIIQWRKFTRNPTADNLPSSLLSGFSSDGVLCEHGQMLKTWQALINESTLYPLTFYEWDVLSHAYPHHLKENEIPSDHDGPEPKITFYPTMYLLPQNDSELKWRLEPSSYGTLCPNCQSEIINDQIFNNARIRIRLVTGFDEALSSCVQSKLTSVQDSLNCVSQDFQADTEICSQPTTDVIIPNTSDQEMDNLREIKDYFDKRCNNLELSNSVNKDITPRPSSDNETSLIDQLPPSSDHHQHVLYDNTNNQLSNHHSESPSTNYIRRSTRQRLNPKDLSIKVNSSDTLLNVKVQLMQFLGVIPSDQHIMSNGLELTDHTKTLQELGIGSKTILYLWSDDPTWDPNRTSFDNGTFKLTTQKSKLNSPCKSTSESIHTESGFKGTRLLEF